MNADRSQGQLVTDIEVLVSSFIPLAVQQKLLGWDKTYNNTLQATFDPLPTFAAAKAVIASNAPERGR